MQALEQVSALETLTGERWTEYVDDGKMVTLIAALARNERPLDLAVVLRELERRGRHLSGALLPTVPSNAGHPVSSLTSWMQLRLPKQHESPSAPGDDDSNGSDKVGGAFSSKTHRILAQADIANFNGQIYTFEALLKNESTKANGEHSPAQYEQLAIGIAKCVVTEDGMPMRLPAMRKAQLLGELQVRVLTLFSCTCAACMRGSLGSQAREHGYDATLESSFVRMLNVWQSYILPRLYTWSRSLCG